MEKSVKTSHSREYSTIDKLSKQNTLLLTETKKMREEIDSFSKQLKNSIWENDELKRPHEERDVRDAERENLVKERERLKEKGKKISSKNIKDKNEDELLERIKHTINLAIKPVISRLQTLEKIVIDTPLEKEKKDEKEIKEKRGKYVFDDGVKEFYWKNELKSRLKQRKMKKRRPLTHTDMEIETLDVIQEHLYDPVEVPTARKIIKERKQFLRIAQKEGPRIAAKVMELEPKEWSLDMQQKINHARREIKDEDAWKFAKE